MGAGGPEEDGPGFRHPANQLEAQRRALQGHQTSGSEGACPCVPLPQHRLLQFNTSTCVSQLEATSASAEQLTCPCTHPISPSQAVE